MFLAGGAVIASLVVALLLVAAIWWRYQSRRRPAGDHRSADLQLAPDSIIKALADGVILVDHRGVVRLLNPSAARTCGCSIKESVGADVRQVLSLVNDKGLARTDAENPFLRVLKNGQSLQEQVAFLLNRQGKPVPISLIVSPVGEARLPTAVVGLFRDVSREFSEEQANNEFISTASHEMRTPLAAIEGYLSLALNDKTSQLNQVAKDYLHKAHTATENLGVLFQDLLTSTRAEDGRLSSSPEAVEVGAALEQIVDGARFSAENKGLEISYLLSRSQDTAATAKVIRPLFYVYVDPHRIREVFQNIIDNAVKYTLSGSVKVSLTGDGRVVQIQVADSGPGIPAEDIPHLFQKFYRVDNSLSRSVGGTGLGLFICRKIVELYNGRIWVESTLGKGSTFLINLPRLPADQAMAIQSRAAVSRPEL